MISSEGVAVAPAALPDEISPRATSKPGWAIWVWVAIACLLLVASWGVRMSQDRRFSQEAGYLEECPFPLKKLPEQIGVWRMVDGGELVLDTKTARITGCTDYVMRNYLDESTGVTLSVLVLFGPAEPVLPHTPQVCFPATGYTEVEETVDRTIRGDDGNPYVFRTAVYAKPGGRVMHREEAYHSFRLDGDWSPNAGSGRKFPRKNPGVFKVQVQRIVAAGERRASDKDNNNPIEQFLAVLIPQIERLIPESQRGGPSKPAGSPGPKVSARDSASSTAIRQARSPGAVSLVGDDPDRDAGRLSRFALGDRSGQPGGEANRQADATDRQHDHHDGREIDQHRQVRQVADRVNFGRIQAVGTVRHPRLSSGLASVKSGREKDRHLGEAANSHLGDGREGRIWASLKVVGEPEKVVLRSIHPRSASGQPVSADRSTATRTKARHDAHRVGRMMTPGNTGSPGRDRRGFLVDPHLERSVE